MARPERLPAPTRRSVQVVPPWQHAHGNYASSPTRCWCGPCDSGPRPALVSHLHLLHPGRRRIAELAADGLTDREIAQTLFVTTRTVEGHLTNVFNKLDVKTRIGLAAAPATPTQAVGA